MTAVLFGLGKWLLGFYLGSCAAAWAYGAASSLITLLLRVDYSSQILLFGLSSPKCMPRKPVENWHRANTQSASKRRKSRAVNEPRKRTSNVAKVSGSTSKMAFEDELDEERRSHGDDSINHLNPPVNRGTASVAVQLRLGLLA